VLSNKEADRTLLHSLLKRKPGAVFN